jgi:polyhydroxybutyrate depolymerase
VKNKLIFIILSAMLIAPAFSEDDEFRGSLRTREVPGWKGRPYDLYIPQQYDSAKPWPVVLALHGGGGNSEHARKITCPDGDINSPKCLDALADREGFIVVYPNGTPNNSFLPKFRTWNATGGINDKYRCIGGTACMENVDDTGYFRNLLDDLSGVANIDQDRIYATGISNGGAMAHRLACELSDRIAAIAPVAAGNQYEAVFGCNPKRPVPALEIHGLKDAQWPYEGGYGKPVLGQPRIAEREEYKKLMVPIRPSMANWAKRNNCATDPTIENFGSVIKETYTKCKDAADVVHYAIKDSGHTWPQGYQYFDESGIGKTNQDINANEIIWEFFKKHPRGGDGEKPSFTLGPGDRSFTLMHDGLARRYLTHIPYSYDGKTKMPVIIAFHGGGANPELIDKEFGGMNAKADKEGFIAVYPYGHKCIDVPGKNMYCWNADSLFRLEFVNYNIDDLGFVSAMIEKLSQDFSIDKSRVYATGASNGAWMAYAAACGLSDKIAAIAPVAGGLALESCAPSRPVSIIHFHGTADPGWPYYGGGSCWTDSIRPPISKTLSKWRDINQCSVSNSTYQKGDAGCETFSCNNSEITFCTIKDGGHTVPGGYSFPIEKLMPWDEDCALGSAGRGVGKVSDDIIALDAMWEFFKKHPLEAEAQ